MTITHPTPVRVPARQVVPVLAVGLLGGAAGVACAVVIIVLRSGPDPTTAWSRAVRLLAGSTAVSGLIGALCGSLLGIVIALASYPDAALFGVVLFLTTVAGVAAGLLGLLVGVALATIGYLSDGRE